MNASHHFGRTRRRAAILAGAIIVLAVIVMLLGTVTQSLVQARRRTDSYERNIQSMFLVEAGMRRALSQLAREPNYGGETWSVPATELDDTWPGEVLIQVQPVEGQSARSIVAESHYPLPMELRFTHTRSRVIADNRPGDLP